VKIDKEENLLAKPQGKLKVVGAVPAERDPNPIAAYANVIVEDETGARWFFKAAAFGFDLKPCPQEGEPFE
jgi:hypothetical protein